LIALAAGGIAWNVSAPFHARMARTLMVTHGGSANLDQALSGRLDIWRDAMRMSAEHPLNGVGVRGFRYAYPAYAPANDHFVVAEPCGVGQGACHPHQLMLEVLAETGAIGLVLWLAAVTLAVRRWWSSGVAARRRAFPVTVALAAMLFPLNTHLAFYSAWWGLLCWWLIGLWCAALYADLDTTDHA
jgi:O-antigen ligase